MGTMFSCNKGSTTVCNTRSNQVSSTTGAQETGSINNYPPHLETPNLCDIIYSHPGVYRRLLYLYQANLLLDCDLGFENLLLNFIICCGLCCLGYYGIRFLYKIFSQPTCKAVKTEYFACLGSFVTLRCEVKNVSKGNWVCPDNRTANGTITDTHCLLEIECVDENSEGEYIFEASSCKCESIKLSIRKPRIIEVIQTVDRTLKHETPEQGKEYRWTYLTEGLPERDIITGMKYTVDGCQLTIKGYLKEDEGIYICRDRETDEQLDAFCLKTKYVEVKVDLTFLENPVDEDFRKKLISSTEQLLGKDQKLINEESFTISETSKITTEAESSSCFVMNAVAYIIKERNSTEYEQMRQRYDPGTVFMLFLSGDRRLPDLDFDRKYIAITFEENENDVKCKFYENQKAVWENLLWQRIGGARTSGVTDNVYILSEI